MGRSVSYPANAVSVQYQDVSHIEEDYEWSDFKDSIRESAKNTWHSMNDGDYWIGREDNVLVENDFARIGVSEYCGLASIWLQSKAEELSNNGDYGKANLAAAWVERISPKFIQLFVQYRKIGTASNGEAFFEKVRE